MENKPIIIENKYLEKIPFCLTKFYTNIHHLDLSNNKLTIIDIINQFINLEILILNKNLIKEIPKTIGSLTKLKILKLNDNKLISLPEEICSLASINIIFNIKNNIC